jgi:AraC-like DNA-binding protein
MPHAPKIRKDILQVLDEYIIPALGRGPVLQVLGEPPFRFSAAPHWVLRKELLPDNDHGPLQVVRYWSQEQLVSSRGLTFGFLYQGSSHSKIGMTQSQARQLPSDSKIEPAGITIIKATAPAIVLYGNHVPHEDGKDCPEQANDTMRSLCFRIIDNQVAAFLVSKAPGSHTSTHHLELEDTYLTQLATIYLQELRQAKELHEAQPLLLALMYRARRLFAHQKPLVSNSCWLDPNKYTGKISGSIQRKHLTLCEDVRDHIQNNLHHPLTLQGIAAHFSLSAFYLNTIFKQVQGITLMRYVTLIRIEVAKQILVEGKERVSEVASLVGFPNARSFGTVFQRHTGLSPNAYRYQHLQKRRELP